MGTCSLPTYPKRKSLKNVHWSVLSFASIVCDGNDHYALIILNKQYCRLFVQLIVWNSMHNAPPLFKVCLTFF